MAVQARRKPAKSGRKKSGGNPAGISMLLAGMVIGCLATILWQGARNGDGEVGAGIRRIFESASETPPAGAENQPDAGEETPARPSTDFSFFAVLTEIEGVAPAAEQAIAETPAGPAGEAAPPAAAETPAATKVGSYMLQAGSYRQRAEAERLKATLALNGMVSAIQKVSIQGRGDFYRVRLGPYRTYQGMEQADAQLSRVGIKALRLKMKSFKAG